MVAMLNILNLDWVLALADEVLLREVPFLFGEQYASLHHRRSLAATNHLLANARVCLPFCYRSW